VADAQAISRALGQVLKKMKNIHIGGEQLILLPPESNWQTPPQLPDLLHCKQIAIDTENRDNGLATGKGPGWATGDGHVCGISVAWRDEDVHARYFPLRHRESTCFSHNALGLWLKDHMRAGVRFVFTNAVYDVGWIHHEWKLKPDYPIDDTCCMAYMCNENRLSYSLDGMCKWRGIEGKDEKVLREAAAIYGLDPKIELWKLPAKFVGRYAEQDALSTLLLAENLNTFIDNEDVRAAYQLEMDLVPMVFEMRRRGVRIDEDAAQQAYDKFKRQSQQALDDLTDRLEHRVTIEDIRSNKWLVNVFDKCKISYPYTRTTGAASFEAKWMKDTDHWLPKLIVRAKQREEAAEKFIKTYIMDFAHNGRLHASIHQYKSENLYDEDRYGGGTRTFRFSYSDPPLQQIPHRDEELAEEIRGTFIAEEDEIWLRADYSQQEYRLIVHFAELSGMERAKQAADRYREDPNTDFHQMVADMTGLARKPAKDCNFAKAYGAGIPKFAAMIKKTKEEAAKIMAQYDDKMPFVKQLFDYCQRRAEDRGYIKLIDGAKIHFDWWEIYWNTWAERQSDNSGDCSHEEAMRRIQDPTNLHWYKRKLRRSRCQKAMNSLIQGNAARQTKSAMRDCWRAGHVPLLQVHDELCFSVRDKQVGKEIGELMRDTFELRVPMKVDLEYGPSWAG
jgi:Mesyanzhinovviridae DNA polymerase